MVINVRCSKKCPAYLLESDEEPFSRTIKCKECRYVRKSNARRYVGGLGFGMMGLNTRLWVGFSDVVWYFFAHC